MSWNKPEVLVFSSDVKPTDIKLHLLKNLLYVTNIPEADCKVLTHSH